MLLLLLACQPLYKIGPVCPSESKCEIGRQTERKRHRRQTDRNKKRVETASLLIVRLRVRPDACTFSPAASLSSHNLPITPKHQHCLFLFLFFL